MAEDMTLASGPPWCHWFHESFHSRLLFGHWSVCSGLHWFPDSWMSMLTLIHTTFVLFTFILRLLSPGPLPKMCLHILSHSHLLLSECSVFPKSHVGVLIPSMIMLEGEAFGRWLGYEGGAQMNEISALITRDPTGLPSSFHQVRIQWKVHNLEEGPHPPCWHKSWIPASRTVSSYFLLFTSHQCVVFCYKSPNNSDTIYSHLKYYLNLN